MGSGAARCYPGARRLGEGLGHGMEWRNIAARAGRWSADRWKTAVGVWAVFVLAALFLGNVAGTRKLTDSETGSGETAKAQSILANANFTQRAMESVLVQSRALAATEP